MGWALLFYPNILGSAQRHGQEIPVENHLLRQRTFESKLDVFELGIASEIVEFAGIVFEIVEFKGGTRLGEIGFVVSGTQLARSMRGLDFLPGWVGGAVHRLHGSMRRAVVDELVAVTARTASEVKGIRGNVRLHATVTTVGAALGKDVFARREGLSAQLFEETDTTHGLWRSDAGDFEHRRCKIFTGEQVVCFLARFDDAWPAHDARGVDAWIREVAFAMWHGHAVVANEDDERVLSQAARGKHIEHGFHIFIEVFDLLEIVRKIRPHSGQIRQMWWQGEPCGIEPAFG